MQRLKAWAPALIWMGVIFIMSATPGDVSGEQSGTVVKLMLRAAALLFGEAAVSALPQDMIHLLVRKGAHMAEYAVLFLCYHHALKKEGIKRPGMMALLLCACYAATDEWHQSFTAGRGPSAADVGIDTAGAGLAWLGAKLFAGFKKKER